MTEQRRYSDLGDAGVEPGHRIVDFGNAQLMSSGLKVTERLARFAGAAPAGSTAFGRRR